MFVEFKKEAKVLEPKVSVWAKGQIGFNRSLVVSLDLVSNKYVNMFYDEDTNSIGFKFSPKKNETSMTIGVSKSGGGIVSAKTFLAQFGITPKQTKSFEVFKNSEVDLHVIHLDQGIISTRKKAQDTTELPEPTTPPVDSVSE